MRKVVFGLILMMLGRGAAAADHLHGVNADNINRGTLEPQRVSPSTFTLQGNTIIFSTVASKLGEITTTSNTLWMPLDGSTNTKLGGATVHGDFSIRRNLGVGAAAGSRRILVQSPTSPDTFGEFAYANGNPLLRMTEGEVGDGYVGIHNDGGTTRMRFVADGESWIDNADTEGFGINTQDPSSLLDVANGSITVRGTNSGMNITGLANSTTLGTDAAGNLIPGPATLMSVYDEGTAQGNANTINVIGTDASMTMVGTTATLTITAAAAASGGGARVYDVIVGTPGMPNVDVVVFKSSDIVKALAHIGAAGLLNASTAPGVILFTGGPYNDLYGATCPAGVTWQMIKGSSSAFAPIHQTSGTLIFLYGTLKDFQIDMSSQLGYTDEKIVMSSGSVIDGMTVIGGRVGLGGSKKRNFIYVANVSTVTIKDLVTRGVSGRNEISVGGENGFLRVERSSNVSVIDPDFGTWIPIGPNPVFLGIFRATNFKLIGGISRNVQGMYFYQNSGTIDTLIDGHEFHYNNSSIVAPLYFTANDTAAGDSSTGTIRNCLFVAEPGSTSTEPLIEFGDNTNQTHGFFLHLNNFRNRSGSAMTAIEIGLNVADTFLLYNRFNGFNPVTDSGTNSRKIH